MKAGCPSRKKYPGSPRTKVTRNTRGVPASGPIPKFCDLRGRWRDLHASSERKPVAPGTDQRRRVAAQDAGRRPRVRSCSPCPGQPDAQLSSRQSAASGQLHSAGRGLDPRAPPLASLLAPPPPRALSATYWGSALAARRGWGRGPARGRASERLQRSADAKLAKARGAAAAFQVRADRSSRRRAAEGGLGTWAPL